MNIQSQSLKKRNLLLTGGSGGLASYIESQLGAEFNVFSPNRHELDVSCLSSVESYFDGKRFDIVVNLAGTLYSSDIESSNPELWIRDININLIGTYLVCRSALLANCSVELVNVSSTAAYNNYSDWTSYCASKAGVMKISGGLFKGGHQVVTLCPGAIDTKLRANLTIKNNSVMTVAEGAKPIIDAIQGLYSSGKIVFYRKGSLEILEDESK